MKFIYLTQGQVAKVDDADFVWLNQWKWHAHYKKHSGKYYATRFIRVDGKIQRIVMHRLILGITDPKVEGDHRDLDTLNNQRYNLRVATSSQNKANVGKRKDNTSGFKGVYKHGGKRKKCWVARVKKDGKHQWSGYFYTAKEAGEAYKKKVIELFGEFARVE